MTETLTESRLCACGCTETFECIKRSKRKFIIGHWMKGKKLFRQSKTTDIIKCATHKKSKKFSDIKLFTFNDCKDI